MAASYDEESDLTRLGIPRRSIRVVPTGIDTAEFTPEGETYDRNDRHRLVTVADLATEQDALDTLLRALAKIPGAELIVAGGLPREDLRGDLSYRRLAKLSDSLDLHGRVFFACEVGRAGLPPLLRSADLMVNFNQHEPSALTSIQAMAAAPPSSRPPSARRSTPLSTAPPASWSSPAARPCSRRRSARCWPTRCSSRRSASPPPTGPARATPGTGSPTRPSPLTTLPWPRNYLADGPRPEI